MYETMSSMWETTLQRLVEHTDRTSSSIVRAQVSVPSMRWSVVFEACGRGVRRSLEEQPRIVFQRVVCVHDCRVVRTCASMPLAMLSSGHWLTRFRMVCVLSIERVTRAFLVFESCAQQSSMTPASRASVFAQESALVDGENSEPCFRSDTISSCVARLLYV